MLSRGGLNSISVTESSIDPKFPFPPRVQPDQHLDKIENLETEIAKKMEEVRQLECALKEKSEPRSKKQKDDSARKKNKID